MNCLMGLEVDLAGAPDPTLSSVDLEQKLMNHLTLASVLHGSKIGEAGSRVPFRTF